MTNPKKALYNRIYNRTTVGVEDLLKDGSDRPRGGTGCLIMIVGLAAVVYAAIRMTMGAS